MSWQLLRLARRCWFCPTAIEPGDLARLGDRTPAIWCVACAAAKLGETPPAAFLDPVAAASAPALVSAPSTSATLFDIDPVGAKFKHADARVALEQLRSNIVARGATDAGPSREDAS